MQQLFLREWRRYRALSQADLAQKARVTEATISRLEQPGHSPARPSTIRKLTHCAGDCPPRVVRATVDCPPVRSHDVKIPWKPQHDYRAHLHHVSGEEQASEGVSLDAQLTECRRYAAQHGWMLGQEFRTSSKLVI